MSTTVTLTHKGWFGLCPVYFANLDGPSPLVLERHRLLVPLLMLSEALFAAAFALCETARLDWQPEWPMFVTGDLQPPKQISLPGVL